MDWLAMSAIQAAQIDGDSVEEDDPCMNWLALGAPDSKALATPYQQEFLEDIIKDMFDRRVFNLKKKKRVIIPAMVMLIDRLKYKPPIATSRPKRERKPVERFSEMSFIKGANNAYTQGRIPIDPYDRQYNGY